MNRIRLLLYSIALLTAGCTPTLEQDEAVLRLAVTTSTQDSGLLDILIPVFEKGHGARVDVIAVGTGAALKLGEAGDVDVVLVHARTAEEEFMEAGHGIRREEVMYNTFEILGPDDDPAEIRDCNPSQALQKISSSGQKFVSRGDNSGTHKQELELWKIGGGRVDWDGYVETGQGMGATLTVADQMNGYVLCDRGTYLKFRNKIKLVPLLSSGENLRNTYGIMVVNPQKHQRINEKLASKFVDFILSSQAQQLIQNYRIDGEQLFFPLHFQ